MGGWGERRLEAINDIRYLRQNKMNLPATKHDMLYGILDACYDDPLLFVESVLGAEPTEQQKQGLGEIARPNAKVSIRSGHHTGKTTLLAWVVLWWVITRYDCKIPITANTGGQLRDNLWPEIHKWRECLPPEIRDEVEITTERIYIKSAPQLQFGVPRTARKENPEALQGFHAKHLLFILDESSGIDEVVFEVARASLSNPGARILMASNPTRTSGYFYESHHEHRNRWTSLHWSCLDSPLPAVEYAREVIEDYGEDSNYYRVRVLGDFPTSEFDQFISLELLEAASIREGVIGEGPVVWGLDPAWMGADETALAIRRGDVIREIKGVRGLDTMQTVGWVINEHREAKDKPDLMVIDCIGIGAGVYDRLKELNYPVIACNVAETPSGVNKYLNTRAELWDRYKEWLQARRGSIPNDKKLIGQSSVVKYDYKSSGKLFIESKADMRKRGVHSPDRADAVCLTFYQQGLARAGYEDEDDDYRPFKAEGRNEVTGY